MSARGISNALPDPMLELYDVNGSLILANDNWRSLQEQQILESTIWPSNDHESAIIALLNPGNYTAIVRGTNNGSGIALVEVYNLEK